MVFTAHSPPTGGTIFSKQAAKYSMMDNYRDRENERISGTMQQTGLDRNSSQPVLSVNGQHKMNSGRSNMYLPEIFKTFLDKHPDLAEAYRKVGDMASDAGPIDKKTQHLVQLGTAIGLCSKGAVRSHARRALEAGAKDEEILQVVLLSMTLVGFPSMIASYGWVNEVLSVGKG
jgi:4-carboxymuconolactone decarboxylase